MTSSSSPQSPPSTPVPGTPETGFRSRSKTLHLFAAIRRLLAIALLVLQSTAEAAAPAKHPGCIGPHAGLMAYWIGELSRPELLEAFDGLTKAQRRGLLTDLREREEHKAPSLRRACNPTGAGYKLDPEGVQDEVLLHHCDTGPGSSGSPLMIFMGETPYVIGINTGAPSRKSRADDPLKPAQDQFLPESLKNPYPNHGVLFTESAPVVRALDRRLGR